MGSCLSICTNDDAVDQQRRASVAQRKRSRASRASAMSYSSHHASRVGSIAPKMPVPDFGISSMYHVMEMLGEGGTGQTWLCQELRTARRVAIKFIPRPLAQILVPMVSQEIQLQAHLGEGHLGLVRMESALLSRTHLGLVMEYVDGGNLTQYVTRRRTTRWERGGLHLDEDEARYFFKQLISAVEYLHKSHVAHRDLKMCNVVLTQRRPPTLKLCDFGFAKTWEEDSVMHTRIGTPVYMSPQLIVSKQDGSKAYHATATDVWACGVVLFAMLLGRFPYDHVAHPDPNSSGARIEVLNEQMKACEGEWAKLPHLAPHVVLLSDECRDLLGKMLETDEAKRISIPAIRQHPWFTAPLPPHLDEALKEAEERQSRLDSVMEAATEEQIKRRNAAVHDLIVLAGQEYGSSRSCSANSRGGTSGGGAVFAIFECATEGECKSFSNPSKPPSQTDESAMGPGKPQLPISPMTTEGGYAMADAQKGCEALGARPCGGSSAFTSAGVESGRSQDVEPAVIVVDLAAVARRTKSDGVVAMNLPEDSDEAADSGRHSGSSGSTGHNCSALGPDGSCGGGSGGGSDGGASGNPAAQAGPEELPTAPATKSNLVSAFAVTPEDMVAAAVDVAAAGAAVGDGVAATAAVAAGDAEAVATAVTAVEPATAADAAAAETTGAEPAVDACQVLLDAEAQEGAMVNDAGKVAAPAPSPEQPDQQLQ